MKNLMFFPLVVCLAIFFCAVGTAQDASLVLRFSFDSQTAKDLSGAGNDGTVAGTSLQEGKFEKALQFNSENDYVHIDNFKGLTSVPAFSVAAWAFLDQSDIASTIVCGITDDENYRWNFAMRVGETFHTNTHKDGWSPELNIKVSAVGAWHHYAAVFNTADKSRTLYLEGKEVGSDDTFQGDFTTTKVRVGRGQSNFPSWYWKGRIDEVVIFSKALTETEIQDIMNGSLVTSVFPRGKLTTTWGHLKLQ